MSNGLELDELEIDPSLFESNTEESYFKFCSRYKSEFKVKESEYFGEINKNFKESYDLLGKNIYDETTQREVRFFI